MFSNYRRRSQGFWSLTDTASHLSKRFSLSCKVYWFCPSCAGYITVGWGCAHPLGCRLAVRRAPRMQEGEMGVILSCALLPCHPSTLRASSWHRWKPRDPATRPTPPPRRSSPLHSTHQPGGALLRGEPLPEPTPH